MNRRLLQYLFAAICLLFSIHAAQAATKVVRYGPFTVPAKSMISFLPSDVAKPCNGCWITKIQPDLVYADGSRANFNTGFMLHHIVLFNGGKTDTTCPAGIDFGSKVVTGERFFASGNERTVMDFSSIFGLKTHGYRVNRGDAWTMDADLMNLSDVTQTVYVEITWGYSRLFKFDLTPVWLDIDQCGDSAVDLPAGYSDTHYQWVSTVRGILLGIGGHVHDKGISIAADDVTTGKHLCTSVAGYAEGSPYAPGPGAGTDASHPADHNALRKYDPSYLGHIEDMSICKNPLGIGIVSPGDIIELHTQYNGDAPALGAMGIMIGWFSMF